MRHLPLAALLALLLVPGGAAAADEQAIAIVVLDPEGAFVEDLRSDELIVLENGQPREVLHFEKDDRKLDVALVLDSSDIAAEHYLSYAYEDVVAFQAALPEKTRCTVWSTGERARRVGELEGDPKKVEKTVAGAFGLVGPNALLNTLVDAAERLGRSSGRRRAIVAVSGTSPGYTDWSPRDVTARVGKARAVVRGVLFREGDGLAAAGAIRQGRDANVLTMIGYMDHERILESLARATGGRFESTGTAVSVGPTLQSFAWELAGQYRIRYATERSKGQRRVEVQVTRRGVRSRITVDTP